MFLTLSGKSFIKNPVQFFSVIPRGLALPHSKALQYYVKREKCKVNDVIFPSGCEARAINLGSKNMKIGIFAGGTSVRSKNIFTDIYRYPTGKHEINIWHLVTFRSITGEGFASSSNTFIFPQIFIEMRLGDKL